jgi:hypothetical protein
MSEEQLWFVKPIELIRVDRLLNNNWKGAGLINNVSRIILLGSVGYGYYKQKSVLQSTGVGLLGVGALAVGVGLVSKNVTKNTTNSLHPRIKSAEEKIVINNPAPLQPLKKEHLNRKPIQPAHSKQIQDRRDNLLGLQMNHIPDSTLMSRGPVNEKPFTGKHIVGADASFTSERMGIQGKNPFMKSIKSALPKADKFPYKSASCKKY